MVVPCDRTLGGVVRVRTEQREQIEKLKDAEGQDGLERRTTALGKYPGYLLGSQALLLTSMRS